MRLSDREAQKVTKNCTQNCAEGWWWWWGGVNIKVRGWWWGGVGCVNIELVGGGGGGEWSVNISDLMGVVVPPLPMCQFQ